MLEFWFKFIQGMGMKEHSWSQCAIKTYFSKEYYCDDTVF